MRERSVANDLEMFDEGNVVVTGVLTVNGVVCGSGNRSAQAYPVAALVDRRIGAAVPEAHATGVFFVDDGESARIVVAKEHDLSDDVEVSSDDLLVQLIVKVSKPSARLLPCEARYTGKDEDKTETV